MMRQFYGGMLAKVQNDGEFSDQFPATNGVKQGCALASTLFSMVFSAVLIDAFQDGDTGIPRSGKPELRHQQQSFLPETTLVLSATGSLEPRLVSSAVLEHTNNNTSRI